MSCELCGISVYCMDFDIKIFPKLDQSGPKVTICLACSGAPDVEARLVLARTPSLVGPPAPPTVGGCESCGNSFSVYSKVSVISYGTHYDVCGVCSWLSPAQLAANIQARNAAGLNPPTITVAKSSNAKPGYMMLTFPKVPDPDPQLVSFWGLPEPEPIKPTKTVAENGLEGMYCKVCNVFCSWVEPNCLDNGYICPMCR